MFFADDPWCQPEIDSDNAQFKADMKAEVDYNKLKQSTSFLEVQGLPGPPTSTYKDTSDDGDFEDKLKLFQAQEQMVRDYTQSTTNLLSESIRLQKIAKIQDSMNPAYFNLLGGFTTLRQFYAKMMAVLVPILAQNKLLGDEVTPRMAAYIWRSLRQLFAGDTLGSLKNGALAVNCVLQAYGGRFGAFGMKRCVPRTSLATMLEQLTELQQIVTAKIEVVKTMTDTCARVQECVSAGDLRATHKALTGYWETANQYLSSEVPTLDPLTVGDSVDNTQMLHANRLIPLATFLTRLKTVVDTDVAMVTQWQATIQDNRGEIFGEFFAGVASWIEESQYFRHTFLPLSRFRETNNPSEPIDGNFGTNGISMDAQVFSNMLKDITTRWNALSAIEERKATYAGVKSWTKDAVLSKKWEQVDAGRVDPVYQPFEVFPNNYELLVNWGGDRATQSATAAATVYKVNTGDDLYDNPGKLAMAAVSPVLGSVKWVASAYTEYLASYRKSRSKFATEMVALLTDKTERDNPRANVQGQPPKIGLNDRHAFDVAIQVFLQYGANLPYWDLSTRDNMPVFCTSPRGCLIQEIAEHINMEEDEVNAMPVDTVDNKKKKDAATMAFQLRKAELEKRAKAINQVIDELQERKFITKSAQHVFTYAQVQKILAEDWQASGFFSDFSLRNALAVPLYQAAGAAVKKGGTFIHFLADLIVFPIHYIADINSAARYNIAAKSDQIADTIQNELVPAVRKTWANLATGTKKRARRAWRYARCYLSNRRACCTCNFARTEAAAMKAKVAEEWQGKLFETLTILRLLAEDMFVETWEIRKLRDPAVNGGQPNLNQPDAQPDLDDDFANALAYQDGLFEDAGANNGGAAAGLIEVGVPDPDENGCCTKGNLMDDTTCQNDPNAYTTLCPGYY